MSLNSHQKKNASNDAPGYFMTGDGASIRYGIWRSDTGNGSGSVVLLNGRREFLEKYDETIGELNRKEFDVYSFDWRGQGMSKRLLPDRLKGHIKSYDRYLQDLGDFINQIVKPNAVEPILFLAHSMGAHVALRFMHDHPTVVYRAVLVAPLIDIMPSPYPKWMIEILTRLAVNTGFAEAYVPGAKHKNPLRSAFEGNPLTSDPERYRVEGKALADNPDLALGGLTFGWLAATLQSISLLRQPGYAERIKTPVLIVGAGKDRVVCADAMKSVCSRMPDCRLKVIEGALHEVLMETDPIRQKFWHEFDRFMK